MLGLSPEVLEKIREMLDQYFDENILSLLGLTLDENAKELIFDTNSDSITSLYIRSLNNNNPTEEEENVLKAILSITNDYAEALKEQTKAVVTNELNAYANGQSLKKEPINPAKVEDIVNGHMNMAGHKFNVIAGAQSNTSKNMGLLSSFSRMSESNDEEEVYIYWRPVPIDNRTSQATFDVHLMPDRVTPKVWKTSEINMGFFKKGDMRPSIFNTSPFCRCAMSYISIGYGFDETGKIVYKGSGYNALKEQRGE